MISDSVRQCSKLLAAKGYTIAFIESATAGRMCAEFSMCGESGEILKGGIVCYDACVKESLLKIPAELIKTYTAESAEVTAALAQQGMPIFNTDVLVAVTGLTGPGGSENEEKPVGTIFLHIQFPDGAVAFRGVFGGKPQSVVTQSIDKAAELIIRRLS
ncbi:CinA family protein [Rurimicrobium arvi]|uniref:CinA family protein n=1 Tax=Rurimicrobium arvi TaxID=2049916 RepID=A0ABP8MVF3_9BACT